MPVTRVSQSRIFWAKEGDRWFSRNREQLDGPRDLSKDLPLKFIFEQGLHPGRVLEIGACNGDRLDLLSRRLGSECHAVEPSAAAIRSGRALYPAVKFYRGLAHRLPAAVKRLQFDLVLVQFVFHWIDREHLLPSAAAIDSVVSDGGFLLIGDFVPPFPAKVKYHHLPKQNVYTYKQDYAQLFLATGFYHRIVTLSGKDGQFDINAEVNHSRLSMHLLRKKLDSYAETSYPG